MRQSLTDVNKHRHLTNITQLPYIYIYLYIPDTTYGTLIYLFLLINFEL